MPIERRIDYERFVTQWEDTGAYNATEFRARVSSIVDLIISLTQSDGGDPAIPGEPEEFVATGGTLSVACSWNAATDAARYRIYRSPDSSPADVVEAGVTPALSFTDLNVTPGNYVYYVVAENIIGEQGPPSEPDSALVTAGVSGSPTTPGSFAASLGSDNSSVDLSWGTPAAGTEAVRIERAFGTSSNFTTIASGVTGTSFTDTTPELGVVNRYRAYGVAADGSESAATAIEEVTVPTGDTVPPAVPQNFAAVAGDGRIDMTWDAVTSSDLDVYEVGSGTSTGVYTKIVEVSSSTTAFPATGLTNATVYYVAVRSKDASGNVSAWSTELTRTPQAALPGDVTPPAAPTNLQGSETSSNTITLTWNEGTDGDLAQYRVYRSIPPSGSSGGPWTQVGTVSAGTTTFPHSPLTVTGIYYFYVTAVDTTGNESSPSTIIPVNFTAGSSSGGDPTEPGGNIDPVATGDDGGNSSSAGITAQYDEGSTVHIYAGNSAEQNANLFIPGLRASRAARTNIGQITTNSDPAQPEIANGVFDSNVSLEWREAWNNSASGLPVYDNVFVTENCGFTPTLGDYDQKWLKRKYHVPAYIDNDVDYVGLWYQGDSGAPYDIYTRLKEHATYFNTQGSAICLNSTADFISGHFFYLSNRIHKEGNLQNTKPELILIQNCHGYNCDMQAGRGSYMLEMHDQGNPTHPSTVIIRNCSFVNAYPFRTSRNEDTRQDPSEPPLSSTDLRSRGILTFFQYIYRGIPQPGTAGGINPSYDPAVDPHICDLLLWQNNLVDVTELNDRPMIRIDNVKDVVFENSLFINRNSSRGEIRLNNDYNRNNELKPCETLTFRNCKSVGDTRVLLRNNAGEDVDLTQYLNCENYEYVIDADTGAVTSQQAIDPTTASTDPAPLINAIDPFSNYTLPGGYSLALGIDGITGITGLTA